MHSFFDKIKETFKESARRIRETAKAAADKIDESAAELSRRIKSAAAGVKQSAADAFRSFKAAFKRPAGAADTNDGATSTQSTEQNAAGADNGAAAAQSAERGAESRTGERGGARQADASGGAKAETGNAASPHEHGGRQCHTKARRFLVHVVDILAGLLFFSAVVIALKPDLLDSAFHISEETIYQNDIPRVIEMSEKVGSYLIQIKISQTIPSDLKIARNIFVALFLALYVVLKIVVVLLAKSPVSQKTVSALMIALTILACALLADKFWIFTAICLIASVAFAFSCGFPARTIFRKFAVFAALALCWYVGAHILTNYDECRKTLHEMGAAIARFGEKAVAFLMALRLPVQA
ncbi:MAG: hypothetical protein K2N31_01775 [Treponemataceae bacterium]|nr:hypothetical protein [Treponemataceae bacterium]